MAQSIVVSQGKNFTVELQSMYGSSGYQWCLSSLPKGIVFTGMECIKIPSPFPIGPVNQIFHFGVVSGDQVMTLEFVLTAVFSLGDVGDTYTVDVQIVPADTQQFIPYSENCTTNLMYGYMCAGQEPTPATDYGYICANQDDSPHIKYGYPCAVQQPIKYGYSCGYHDAAAQANQPFHRKDCTTTNQPFHRKDWAATNQPFHRNDWAATNQPFHRNDVDTMKAAMPYGMVYADDCIHKYGFPHCK